MNEPDNCLQGDPMCNDNYCDAHGVGLPDKDELLISDKCHPRRAVLRDHYVPRKDFEALQRELNACKAALTPFAKFGRTLNDGRRGYPKTGELYALDTGAPTEAVITIEDFEEAIRLTTAP